MNVFRFKTLSVKIVLDFRDVSYAHVAIYVICAVYLFLCYKMSRAVHVVYVPAKDCHGSLGDSTEPPSILGRTSPKAWKFDPIYKT